MADVKTRTQRGDLDPERMFLEEIRSPHPDWSAGGEEHNWKNYIGPRLRLLWSELDPLHREQIALDADDRTRDEPE